MIFVSFVFGVFLGILVSNKKEKTYDKNDYFDNVKKNPSKEDFARRARSGY